MSRPRLPVDPPARLPSGSLAGFRPTSDPGGGARAVGVSEEFRPESEGKHAAALVHDGVVHGSVLVAGSAAPGVGRRRGLKEEVQRGAPRCR